MKTRLFFLVLMLGLVFVSCKKDDSGTGTTPPPATEDWTFPGDAATTVKLYCDKTTVAVGAEFDVKLVLYNVTDVFGIASEITYNNAVVEVTSILTGPAFTPATDILTVSQLEAAQNRASHGVTYRAGTGRVVTGSGAVMKLKCKGRAAGTATFTISPAPKLDVKKSDGTAIVLPVGAAINVTVQ